MGERLFIHSKQQAIMLKTTATSSSYLAELLLSKGYEVHG
jgi:GDP-D-mannose dehydratase